MERGFLEPCNSSGSGPREPQLATGVTRAARLLPPTSCPATTRRAIRKGDGAGMGLQEMRRATAAAVDAAFDSVQTGRADVAS